jgi:hypothetical protein
MFIVTSRRVSLRFNASVMRTCSRLFHELAKNHAILTVRDSELVHHARWTRSCTPQGLGGDMRGHTWSGISAAIVLAATVGVAAQEPSPSQNSPQPAPQPPATSQAPATAPQTPQTNDARRITVAGCLQAAPSSPVGTSGSAAPAPAPSTSPDAAAKPEGESGTAKLVLVNAVPSPAEGAADTSSSAPQTYRLIANEGSLMPHVGKKLELTGTIEDQNSASRPATSEPNDSSAANAPQLRVESGKVVASTCMP